MRLTFVDPGELKTRLRLETPAEAPDGQGGVTEGWNEVAELWGRVEPLRAKPGEEAGALTAPISHRVTVRCRADIRHAMRFVSGNRQLLIRALRDPDERRRYLVCECEEAAP